MTEKATFILGRREVDGQDGVFVAPPGIDARVAATDDLSLYVTTKIPQLAMTGVISPPFPVVVPHTIGFAPIILPNLISTNAFNAGAGYIRPFDTNYIPGCKSSVKSEATQFTFAQTDSSGRILPINYFAYAIEAP